MVKALHSVGVEVILDVKGKRKRAASFLADVRESPPRESAVITSGVTTKETGAGGRP